MSTKQTHALDMYKQMVMHVVFPVRYSKLKESDSIRQLIHRVVCRDSKINFDKTIDEALYQHTTS